MTEWKLKEHYRWLKKDGPAAWIEEPWHPMHDFVTVDYLNALQAKAALADEAAKYFKDPEGRKGFWQQDAWLSDYDRTTAD